VTERITARKNALAGHLRTLGRSGAYRRENGSYVCDGEKLLREALRFGAEVKTVLWREKPGFDLPAGIRACAAPAELYDYVSPLQNSPGPLFEVAIPAMDGGDLGRHVLVLENVQDPGNVGTVLRTANAFGCGTVVLTGACADLYNPKTVRAAMGALFRQRVVQTALSDLPALLGDRPLYGAALTDTARDLREMDLTDCAVAIGSEGKGLSAELLSLCRGELIIPMQPDSESLNAAVAAAVVLWECVRRE
jgi:TrmH family RNA methyltransferase